MNYLNDAFDWREVYDISDCFNCGSKNIECSFDEMYVPPVKQKLNSIECVECGVRGPIMESAEEAVDAWNALHSYKVMCDRVDELEQENNNLRGLTVKLARECFDDGYDAGMKGFDDSQERASQKGYRAGLERAIKIAEKYRGHYYDAVAAIHAELKPVTRPNV